MEQAREQADNPYWRAVLSDIEAYLKYQLLKMVRVVAVEVENPVEAKFFRATDVVLTLLEERGL